VLSRVHIGTPYHPIPIHVLSLQMFKPVRVIATIIFLSMIIMIFVSAFVLHSGTLSISKRHLVEFVSPVRFAQARDAVFVVLEYLAFLWYTLSYIPYARAAVLKVFGMA
jgi:hypothetical protein